MGKGTALFLFIEDGPSALCSLRWLCPRIQRDPSAGNEHTETEGIPGQAAPQDRQYPKTGSIPRPAASQDRQHPKTGSTPNQATSQNRQHPRSSSIPKQAALQDRQHPTLAPSRMPPFPTRPTCCPPRKSLLRLQTPRCDREGGGCPPLTPPFRHPFPTPRPDRAPPPPEPRLLTRSPRSSWGAVPARRVLRRLQERRRRSGGGRAGSSPRPARAVPGNPKAKET